MRLRNKPGSLEYLKNNKDYFLPSEKIIEKNYFNKNYNDKPLYLEIGTGKGNFIIKHATEEGNKNFLALEKYSTVLMIAIKKLEKLSDKLSNIKLICEDARDLPLIFDDNSLDGIYINFPDPWPKSGHKKRRLMHNSFLKQYHSLLKRGGFIEFKSDQKHLYDFWFEEIESMSNFFRVVSKSEDLHKIEEVKFTTEYEKKFTSLGNSIYFLKLEVLK